MYYQIGDRYLNSLNSPMLTALHPSFQNAPLSDTKEALKEAQQQLKGRAHLASRKTRRAAVHNTSFRELVYEPTSSSTVLMINSGLLRREVVHNNSHNKNNNTVLINSCFLYIFFSVSAFHQFSENFLLFFIFFCVKFFSSLPRKEN